MRLTKSWNNYLPEITADQAAALNAYIPRFDNNMSMVYQLRPNQTARNPLVTRPSPGVAGRDGDWRAQVFPCGPVPG